MVLPFLPSETFSKGIFEYKFTIEGPAGYMMEGGSNRRERVARRYYYGSMRKNRSEEGIKKLVSIKTTEAVHSFVHTSFTRLTQGHTTPDECLRQIYDLTESYTGVQRIHAEALVEEMLAQLPEAPTALRTRCMLVLAGFVGMFGLSSRQKPAEEEERRVYPYYYSTRPKKRFTLPQPRDWCFAILSSLPVGEVYDMNLEREFGILQSRVVVGLRELCERVAADGSYQWLFLVPILQKHKELPTLIENEEFSAKSKISRFHATLKDVKEVATSTQQKYAEERETRIAIEVVEEKEKTSEASVSSLSSNLASVSIDDEKRPGDGGGASGSASDTAPSSLLADREANKKKSARESPELSPLTLAWVNGLTRYSPSMDCLTAVFDDNILLVHMHWFVRGITAWVEAFVFSSPKEVQSLTKLASLAPAMQTYSLASALFRNPSIDDGKLPEAVLEFVQKLTSDRQSMIDQLPEAVKKDPHEQELLDKEAFDLESASKDWIRRNHAHEEKDPEENRISIGYFYSRRETKKPTPAELAKKRLSAMREACEQVDGLLAIPFFSVRCKSITFELGRCHFFKGSPELVITALCVLGSKTKSFTGFVDDLAAYLVSSLSRLVEDIMPSLTTKHDSVRDLVNLFNDKFAKDSEARHSSLHSVVSAFSAPPLKLQTVLRYAFIWELLFESCGTSESSWTHNSLLNDTLRSVRDLLVSTAGDIASSTIVLSQLHVVIKSRAAFLNLCDQLKCSVVSEAVVTQRQVTLRDFDTSLAQVQCFVNFFCNCGVPIDTAEIRASVSRMTSNYDRLELKEVQGVFDDLLRPYEVSIQWLFQLRNSALFLNLWRQTGREIFLSIVEDDRKEREQKDDELQINRDLNRLSLSDQLDELVAKREKVLALLNVVADDEERNGDDPNNEARRQMLEGVLIRLGEEEHELQAKIDSGLFSDEEKKSGDVPDAPAIVVLDLEPEPAAVAPKMILQTDVIAKLLPAVKERWRAFKVEVRDQTASIDKLQATFATLPSPAECDKELRLLALTGEGVPGSSVGEWVAESSARLRDFLLLARLRFWLPALLKLRRLVGDLVTTPEHDDEYFEKTAALAERQEKEWKEQTLRSVTLLVEPLKGDILDHLTPLQLDFISSLTESEGLMKWLLEHHSTAEFNRLLQVCRPCTDEPRLLSSIASLVQIRTILIQILYTDGPYSNLIDFLHAFHRSVPVDEDALAHLRNIQSSFEGLLDVFEKQTRSPGIKSCYEVRDISKRGQFVFCASSREDEVLYLEMLPFVASTSATATGANESGTAAMAVGATESKEQAVLPSSSAEAAGVRREPLEYLLDLRSKLMMTEIPAELEAELGINALVESFVLQLQILVEMRDEIFKLFSLGHFEYQIGFEKRFSFDMNGLQGLNTELAALRAEVGRWEAVVRDAREKHYFLNYFTMREILMLTELLNAVRDEHSITQPNPAYLGPSGSMQSLSLSDNSAAVQQQQARREKARKDKEHRLATDDRKQSDRAAVDLEMPPDLVIVDDSDISRRGSEPPKAASPKKKKKGLFSRLFRRKRKSKKNDSDDDEKSAESNKHNNNIYEAPSPSPVAPSPVMKPKGPIESVAWPCPMCTFENPITAEACAMCTTSRPPEYMAPTALVSPALSPEEALLVESGESREIELDPFEEFLAMSHLVSSTVDVDSAREAVEMWTDLSENAPSLSRTADSSDRFRRTGAMLHDLGAVLDTLFGRPRSASSAPHHLSALPELADEKTADPSSAAARSSSATATGVGFVRAPVCRAIPPPGADSQNRSDMLFQIESETDKIPVWVTSAESPSHVIDVVLSVYVRRARLPEPGEIVFCTDSTTLEDISLLFYRFLNARRFGRGECVFCVADIHALSYTTQCAVVERLREMLRLYTTASATSLLFVSGKPRQVILNSLSAQAVELPPLDQQTLQMALSRACGMHCGETACVVSNINGGGKTHFILRTIGERQKVGEPLLYRRVPFREHSTTSSLVHRLSLFKSSRNAFHLDIGHIVPPNANTMLFELLILGVLKDSQQGTRVYHRSASDVFYLEIPNSKGEKTAEALRFCSLLPMERLSVVPDSLDLVRPIFTNAPECTRVSSPEYTEIVYVCKFLRAYEAGKFKPGATYDAEYSPWMDQNITPAECFNLLAKYTAYDGYPSFLVFHSFLQFMYSGVTGMESYPVFMPVVLQNQEGLEALKDVFTTLLIETTKDFALRAVPRGQQFGGKVKGPSVSQQLEAAMAADRAAVAAATLTEDDPLAPPMLDRVSSSEYADVAARLGPTQLVRELSNDMATRFDQMVSWEDTEHPVVLFYTSSRSQDISGMDILSLNPRFVDRFIQPAMKEALKANAIDLEKDWKNIKSEVGIEILMKVEGFSMVQGGGKLRVEPVDPSYVITVDNLLKMLSIQMRLKNHLPVVIMGETGCGKSSLIRQLCSVIRAPLRTLNIHGGMEDEDVVRWMQERVSEAKMYPRERIVVFLDEVNTCNSMGLFKEMICDGSMNGTPLPDNMRLIAACNPYRLKKGLIAREERMAGLIFDHHLNSLGENVGSGIHDPLKDLVYRVHPLPESMIDHVFDFGALTPQTEQLYIKAMLRRQISIYLSEEEALMEEKTDPTKVVKGQAASMGLSEDNQLDETLQADLVANVQQAEDQAKQMETGYNRLTELGEFVAVFAELICAAQEFVRSVNGGERSVVSLRDVARCLKVYRWFGEHFATNNEEHMDWTLKDFFAVRKNARPYVRQAVILSLAYCYHARLPREERRQFCRHVGDAYQHLQLPLDGDDDRGRGRGGRRGRNNGGRNRGFGGFFSMFWGPRYGPRSTWLDIDAKCFDEVLRRVQTSFVSNMNLEEGIALNEALLENLFMMLVSVLNRIPIFVIGKPGSSKSLAMGLIQSNLNGDASDNRFLRSLPAVEVFSYQCSPLSTSAGIEQAFEAANRYVSEAQNTLGVVLLDEVGLAEQSPHLPLKVLHKVLDEAGGEQPVVGISNWALDPAKMNRAVHLYRPAPTVEDLSLTAEGMVRSANLKGYLQSLARAYNDVYQNQGQEDFWGLREFYSTVRHINRLLRESNKPLDSQVVMNAVQRNFGGRPSEMDRNLNIFFSSLGLPLGEASASSVVTLINENLVSEEARHLMLLTENNAALGLLFDNRILHHDQTEVIFGSDFPLDQTDLQICLNIQRVKLCMAEGITVVLVHCDSLYESLYDLLNQHYTEYGGQLYVRLAFGTHSRLCPIHRKFRVVVVVEKDDAYNRLAPPLLNRFEKQVMERQDLLTDEDTLLVKRLERIAFAFCGSDESLGESISRSTLKTLRQAFCGFHPGLFASLAQSVAASLRSDANKSETGPDSGESRVVDSDSIFLEAVLRLLWITVPEAVCRLMGTPRVQSILEQHDINVPEEYFKKQSHSDLPNFLNTTLSDWNQDGVGAQVVLTTYSPLTFTVKEVVESQTQWDDVSVTVLHELSSERDLVKRVDDFFDSAKDGSVLVVQCDPLAASYRRINHARYICENSRAKFVRRRGGAVGGAVVEEKEQKGDSGVRVEEEEEEEKKRQASEALKEQQQVKRDDEKSESVLSPSSGSVNTGIHIVFLVHLPRNDMAYQFDMDRRWRYAFIDSTESSGKSGLPDIQSMLGQSMTELMTKLDLRQLLLRNFRNAMTRLVYLYQRTNEDVRKQIMFLLRRLEEADPAFVGVLQRVISEMVAESSISLNVMETANQERELALAGTFQAALHRKITDTVSYNFAIVLSHIDRNSGLYLVGNDDPYVADIWSYLFVKSFTDMNVCARSSSSDTLEVLCDGASGQAFESRFPFSFYISRLIESMKQAARASGGEVLSDVSRALDQQFKLVGLEHGLADPLPASIIQRYIFDFTCMHGLHSPALPKEKQAAIVSRVMELAAGRAPETLPEVHSFYWETEQLLHACFKLIDAVPASLDAIFAFLSSERYLAAETLLGVVDAVVATLNPDHQKWSNAADYGNWTVQVEMARPTIVSLLASTTSARCYEGVRVASVVRQTASSPSKKSNAAAAAAAAVSVDDEKSSSGGDVHSTESKMAPDEPSTHTTNTSVSTLDDTAGGLVAGGESLTTASAVAVVRSAPHESVVHTHSEWERLLLAYRFVRDIAMNLRIDPQLTVSTLMALKASELRSQETFHVLIRMLSDLNRHYARAGMEVECAMCLCIPNDPVRFCGDCQQMVCRACVEEYMHTPQWLNNRACFWCRKNKAKPFTVKKSDLQLCMSSKDLEDHLQSVARRFMEFYIVEFCLVPSVTGFTENKLLRDFLFLISERSIDHMGEKYFIDVLPPGSGRVSLLRTLLELDSEHGRDFVLQCITEELLLSVSKSEFLDTPLSVCYTSVVEESLAESIRTVAEARAAWSKLNWAVLDLSPKALSSSTASPIEDVLQVVATARRVLVVLATALCETIDTEEAKVSQDKIVAQRKAARELMADVSVILSLDGKQSQGIVRSARMFLLKQMERRRGVSFVRSVMQQEPVRSSSWFREWLDSADTGLLRFMGDNKLPKHNPLLTLENWDAVHVAVCASVSHTGKTDVLQELFSTSPDGGVSMKGAFLAAVFHEVTLLSLLDDIPALIAEKVAALRQWITSSETIRNLFSVEEHILLCSFAGCGAFSGNATSSALIRITPQSRPEDIRIIRVLCHVAALSLSGPKVGKGIGLLRLLTLSPKALAKMYIPSMPEDATAMAVRVLGGRWYKCPNGHAYYVDMCGRPTVVQKCATCGVEIGGNDHDLLGTNKDLDENLEGNTDYSQTTKVQDRSDPGYCFREASIEADSLYSVRELSPIMCRLQRFLVHSSMVVGSIIGPKWEQEATKHLMNPTFCNNVKNVGQHVCDHLLQDWAVLKQTVRRSDDDIAMLLHSTLQVLSEDKTESGRVRLASQADRSEWESYAAGLVQPVFNSDDIAERLEVIYAQYSPDEDDEGSVFVSELQERVDVSFMTPTERAELAPALWRFRRPFSLQDFSMELTLNPKRQAAYPLLASFLEEEAQLRALCHIPAVVEWIELLLKRYNRKIDYATASSTTVGEVLESSPPSWRRAFEGFQAAWNESWQHVERFGCMAIPALYKNMKMELSTPISFCLPNEKDEGICPLTLANFLGQNHNRFIERVDEYLLMRGDELQRSGGRQGVVSSKFFSQGHSLSYDFGVFAQFVEKQCVRNSKTGSVIYDFRAAEQYLLDRFLSGKPLIDLVVRMVQFTDAAGVANTSLLRQKVEQVPLPPDMAASVVKDLGGPTKAQVCLDLLETCISFLQSTGGSYIQHLDVGEKTLGEYTKDVLLMKDAEFGSRVVSHSVQLKHVDALWKLLRNITEVDPFANVRQKYREEMDEKSVELVMEAGAHLDKSILLPAMKEFISSQLVEDHISADGHIKEIVGYLESQDGEYLVDLPWFATHFPSMLQMRHALSVFNTLES